MFYLSKPNFECAQNNAHSPFFYRTCGRFAKHAPGACPAPRSAVRAPPAAGAAARGPRPRAPGPPSPTVTATEASR